MDIMEPIISDTNPDMKDVFETLNGNKLIKNYDKDYVMPYDKNGTEKNGTPIQRFYAGQSIFITGGTGFLGKVLIEKLLRSCPDISTIYIMIRSKKDKNPKNRLNEMFQSSLYDRVRKEVPHFYDKIEPIIGEFNTNGLVLLEEDKNILIHEVSIIFHLAATVRFDEPLKTATMLNVHGARSILDIAKSMKKLKSFIHVSTVYANCHLKNMSNCEENFYTYPIDYDTLLSLMSNSSEDIIDKSISSIISQWPNTYTFTKAIAESLLSDTSRNLPIGIFRPSIVISTAHEPLVGWTDNSYGPMGLMAFIFNGLVRILAGDPDKQTNLVPVDMTINALIASAWDVFNQPERRGNKMLIYNHVSSKDAPLTWSEYLHAAQKSFEKYPTKNCIWMPTATIIKRKTIYIIYIWLFHLLPALLFEITRACLNVKKNLRIWALYKKIHKLSEAFTHFTFNEWIYNNDNVHAMWQHLNKEDQRLFNFNMKGFDWPKYLDIHFKGIRTYLLNDDISTLTISRIKWKRLYWLHQMLKTLFICIVFWFIWRLIIIFT